MKTAAFSLVLTAAALAVAGCSQEAEAPVAETTETPALEMPTEVVETPAVEATDVEVDATVTAEEPAVEATVEAAE